MNPTPRLIVIDDDPLLAEVVVHIARDAYAEDRDLVIECALTPEAALVAIGSVDPEHDFALIVISDFHIPPGHATGLDILAEVKRRLPRATRVLMTGRDPEEIALLLEQAQLDRFLAKPFRFDEVRALIVAHVERVGSRAGRVHTVPVASPPQDLPLAVWPALAGGRQRDPASGPPARGNPHTMEG